MSQIQAVNDVGNLLFFVLLLAIVILIAILGYRAIRGRTIRGPILSMSACLFVYAAILLAVSLSSETRSIALGTDKCFDDWCTTVVSARSIPNAKHLSGTKFVAVTLRVSNRARQAALRPSQPRVSLVLAGGVAVIPSTVGQREFEQQTGVQEDLRKRLTAGESFQTSVVFNMPAATREASGVLLEGPAIVTRFLVGDENSFFHKKMVYPITVE